MILRLLRFLVARLSAGAPNKKDLDRRACIPYLSVNHFDFPDDNGSYFPSCLDIPPSGCSSCGDWRNMRDVPG